jgi:hypothetical protein
MFRPKWPSSGVQIVVFQDSAAHCNAGFFLLLLLSLVIFGYVGFILFNILVVAALSVLVGAGILLCRSLIILFSNVQSKSLKI